MFRHYFSLFLSIQTSYLYKLKEYLVFLPNQKAIVVAYTLYKIKESSYHGLFIIIINLSFQVNFLDG